MKQLANVRKFTVAPEIIYSLIKAQAGTLAKSVGECVMNSIDAGAGLIKVEVKQDFLTIRDDGRGFQSRQEIEQCFEVFGFEHKPDDRTFGQFGIGRAQLWNYCSTVWTTNQFCMVVDIKNRGLDYDLAEGLPRQAGLLIEGTLYQPLTASELVTFEREFRELVRYVEIPVWLNGKRVSHQAAREKWTSELPEAWFRIRESGELAVYNRGFFVRRYPSYQFGCGGIVVTKPGVKLALNMARNDILTSECEVWKRLKPFLQQQGGQQAKKVRLTDARRGQLAHSFLAGSLAESEVKTAKLVQDILGKYHSLGDISPELLWGRQTVSTAGPGNALAEYVHRSKRAFILQSSTLDRFGSDSVGEFMERLKVGMSRIHSWYKDARPVSCEDFREVCRGFSDLRLPVPPREWTREEAAAVAVLNRVSVRLFQGLKEQLQEKAVSRRIDLGASDVAGAWTDGSQRIMFDRKTIACARQGIGGWQFLLNMLLQEYLKADASGQQDEDFYRRYYEVMTQWSGQHLTLLETAYKWYVNDCRQKGIPVTVRALAGFDLLEGKFQAEAEELD